MQMRRKYKTKKAERISEFNKKKEYSKMLRAQEELERIEEQAVALKQAKGRVKIDSDHIMRKYAKLKKVKFANDIKLDEDLKITTAELDWLKVVLPSEAQKSMRDLNNSRESSQRNGTERSLMS